MLLTCQKPGIFAAFFAVFCLTHCMAGAQERETTETLRIIQTTKGALPLPKTGLILPHEHLFTDLRGPDAPGYAEADPAEVERVMKPYLDAASSKGVCILVECSSVGVGRNVEILERLGRSSGIPLVVPTGVYGRGKFAPPEFERMSEAALRDWMISEITQGIGATGIKAGFIKLACDATALTEFQKRQLRAAAAASLRTGVAIAIHTPSGERAMEQADLLEAEGLSLDRFIWVHAQNEPNLNLAKEIAARGAYIELDSIGSGRPSDEEYIQKITYLVAAGYRERILLSHDAGWYQPGSADGGKQRGYSHLADVFIPALKAQGADEALIRELTLVNPFRAFSIPAPENR